MNQMPLRMALWSLAALLPIASCGAPPLDPQGPRSSPRGRTGSIPPAGTGLTPRAFPELPFDLAEVRGIQELTFSEEAKALLSRNGFVVVGPSTGNMSACYEEGPLAAFVTVDSVLEMLLSHVEDAWGEFEAAQADRWLKLQATLWDCLAPRLSQLPPGARPAGNRLLGLLAVGRSLAEPSWGPEEACRPLLGTDWSIDLGFASRGEGTGKSLLWRREAVDWSAFQPAGAYRASESLARWYRAIQWWSRFGFRTFDREDRTALAVLSWAVHAAQPSSDVGPYRDAYQFERRYARFFESAHGISLDIVLDLAPWAKLDDAQELGSDSRDSRIAEQLNQSVSSAGEVSWARPGDPATPDADPRQAYLIRPWLTLEHQVFGRLSFPLVPGRFLPRGLDFLAALGDRRAQELALSLEAPGAPREALAREFGAVEQQAVNATRYSAFPHVPPSLRNLMEAMLRPRSLDRLPLFMRGEAYHDRSIASALATWAASREIYNAHLLGNAVVGAVSQLKGIAEPNLDAWQRLVELSEAWKAAFRVSGISMKGDSTLFALAFRRIAEKQLEGTALGEMEEEWFHLYDYAIECEIKRGRSDSPEESDTLNRSACTTLARSRAPDRVRWAGKSCSTIYVVVEWEGELHLCKGGVFDYYEFDLPPGQALSRKDFRERLLGQPALAPPDWTRSYRALR